MALLAGCVAGIPVPLYSPIEVGLSFGYSDAALSDTRYEVTYVAPTRTTYVYGGEQRSRESERQVELAYDMALWRAADLALARGFPAFRVAERNNDARVDVRYEYYDDGPYDPFFDHRGHFHYGPFSSFTYPRSSDRYALLSARVTIVADLVGEGEPDAFDARMTRDRLREKYPQAVGPEAGSGSGRGIGEQPGGALRPS